MVYVGGGCGQEESRAWRTHLRKFFSLEERSWNARVSCGMNSLDLNISITAQNKFDSDFWWLQNWRSRLNAWRSLEVGTGLRHGKREGKIVKKKLKRTRKLKSASFKMWKKRDWKSALGGQQTKLPNLDQKQFGCQFRSWTNWVPKMSASWDVVVQNIWNCFLIWGRKNSTPYNWNEKGCQNTFFLLLT